MPPLQTQSLTLAYDATPVVDNLNLSLEPGTITTLIGPNGCGKSTVLRALARLMVPRRGAVLLDGEDIHRLPTRLVAQSLGLLAQHAEVPGGLTVVDLVKRGRYPHRRAWEPQGPLDDRAVEAALVRCDLGRWRDRRVDELSGGQRQRVWIALALTQDTPVILMDEPTTFLDPGHQDEVLSLIQGLHQEGKTLVLVLHDIAQAARISHRIVVMKAGAVVFDGPPRDLDSPLLEGVYQVPFARDEGEVASWRPQSRLDRSQPRFPHPSAPILEARSVVAGYEGRPVVGPVTLTLGPGFHALLGPNGGGKSTLLKTLAGLHPFLNGAVWLDGRPLPSRGRDLARSRAFLCQESPTPPGITVAGLAAMGRYPHRGPWGREKESSALGRALRRLDLDVLAHRRVDSLSGGQRQRVWLALALVQDTSLIFLDEPTSFLDPGHQIEILDALWSLTRTSPRTIVAILHDPVLAQRYADQVICLDGHSQATEKGSRS